MPDSAATHPPAVQMPWLLGLKRGFRQRCPGCGAAPLFNRYLKVNQNCIKCGLSLGEFRADDAPPYFTILLVGHIIVPSMLVLEQLQHPAQWIHMMLWIPLTLALTLFFLPRMKGAVIGVQWANGIRG
jgi:uncharacterized protein (DUF983 family)